MSPTHFKHARRRRSFVTVATTSLGAFVALIACAPVPAHDWPSPPVDSPLGQNGGTGDQATRWSGLLWHGPAQGAPAAPRANDCRRPPASFELPGPQGWPLGWARGGASPPLVLRRDGVVAERPAAALADSPPRAPDGAREAGSAAGSAKADAAPSVAEERHDANGARPATVEPVTAGVVDDNADFEAYLQFRQRWASVPQRGLRVDQRVRLDVRDTLGRPVPDAEVRVTTHGREVALWARTDAGGQAWLMPQADTPGDTFEVRVRKGAASSAVRWRRGQRDALQVRLDGAATERARLDIVFAIDATGSMGDEIHKLKVSMHAAADQIARLPSQPDLCFGLVAYRDRGDEFFIRGADLTNDLDAFQSMLARLQARGGGDYPEAMNEALHTAVHRLAWRGEGTARIVVLLADAPPHLDYGAPHYDDDLRAAQARGIKVFAVGASGLDRQGEVVMRQMAQFTGGHFVFLTYADRNRPASGPGRETVHDVRDYSVESLDKLLVRLLSEEMARWPLQGG